ncbi:SIR2 family protein [Ferroacidibacillus organovorans]|uniref:Uncharacterized protein n=1 Tax=Ferroacidibacillus organovorans TaxID=1765683 RepID=A0A1V4ETA8_9BACL|nr:SIR2 family protein [Ferroacidibacillus organovorans]OPG16092.1 hypothetical protein B2M26_08600 [Ferroacidibacillus organovorans]
MSEIPTAFQGHLDLLRSHLNDRKAVLFVGAGLSLNATPKYAGTKANFKSWTSFILQLANRLWAGQSEKEIMNKISGNHLMIAQLYQEEYGSESFYNELLQAVPYRHYEPSQIHKDLLTLTWRDFVTTNQDLLLEDTLTALHIPFDTVIDDLDIPIKTEHRKLYKMHGCMTRPSSIVFSEEQYRVYENIHPLLYVKLKAIFAEYTVAFVGFSLTDPNFKAIHGWVGDVLSKEYQRKAYAFVLSHEIDRYTQRYWEKRNVILLPVDTRDGRSFSEAMTPYISFLRIKDERDEKENARKIARKKIEEFMDKYSMNQHWSVDGVQDDVLSISTLELDQNDIQKFGTLFLNMLSNAEFTEQDRYRFIRNWKPILSPLIQIDGVRILDFLINVLEEHSDWDTVEKLLSYVRDKTEMHCLTGEYREASETAEKYLVSHQMPVELRNDLRYLQILAAKFEFDLARVQTLLGDITPDSSDSGWLNRLGNIYMLLGNGTLAEEYFRRAQEIATQRRDNWNLYVAYLSLSMLYSFRFSTFDQNRLEDIRSNLRKLVDNFKEKPDPRFERLRSLDDLKGRLNKYELWRRDVLHEASFAYSSESSNIYYDFYSLLYFTHTSGVPDAVLNSEENSWLGELFFEHGQVERGVKFAIYFGYHKFLKRTLNIDRAPEFLGQRNLLLNVALNSYRLLEPFLKDIGTKNYVTIAQGWLTGLVELLHMLMPVVFDAEMKSIEDVVKDLFQVLTQNKRLDPFASIRTVLIQVMGDAAFFRKDDTHASTLSSWIETSANDFRLARALESIPWEHFEFSVQLNDAFINRILQDSGYGLLSRMLDKGLLSEEQREFVYEKVYGDDDSDIGAVFNGQFYLLRHFGQRLNEERRAAIIASEIMKNANQYTSHDLWLLHELLKLIAWVPNDPTLIETLFRSCERKIARSQKEHSMYAQRDIVTVYLLLLKELVKHPTGNMNQFFDVFEKYKEHLSSLFHDAIEVFRTPEKQELMVDVLKKGIRSIEIRSRQSFLYLTGCWLGGSETFSHAEQLLYELVLASVQDTNVDVASESLRSIAVFVEQNQTWTNAHLASIVDRTVELVDRNHIPFLANLALVYSTMSRRVNDTELKSRIANVLEYLSTSPYSNVRRVITHASEMQNPDGE